MADETEPLEDHFAEIEILNGPAYERLQLELNNIKNESPEGIAITIKDDDLFRWRVFFQGPEGTPYEGGNFSLKLYFPSGYPDYPPLLCFKTKIFHPNVDSFGIVHLEILLPTNWSPIMSVLDILRTVQDVLVCPQPSEYCDPVIIQRYQQERVHFIEQAKEWTQMYAIQQNGATGILQRLKCLTNLSCCRKQNSYATK